jgi:diguanylate cyclase (GGDEF)-like protein
MGVGILAMHFIGLKAWYVAGTVQWNVYGVVMTFVLGLGLSALAVNRANRPATRRCRHGAAIVLAFMICTMHYALAASTTTVADASVALPPYLIPAGMLGFVAVAAVLLVMGSGFSTYIIDLRSRTESADRIHQLSFNDTMTGLPNRIAFNERLAFDAAEAHEKAHKLAAFSIDVDCFKDVNDLFGHGAGDLLLIEVADRMRRLLGPGEFLARQSGDEFLGLQTANHPHDAHAFAGRVAEVFSQPFRVQGQAVTLTASIGFSIFPVDSPERDQVLSNAKLAMHRGKSKQRGAICQYQREMDDIARARRALARDLQTAAERGELELHYQLQTSLANGKICGAEALMRWRHPKRGMISPAEFIPLAEETETIIPMGEWALRTACRDAAVGKIPGTVAVNLSPVQFGRDDLAETIHAILLGTGLSPKRLEVEVTESTIMSDQTPGLHILRKLKAMGISVAMDDFGTGYSSLATLHAFPFDKIKLDQSFVKRLPDDAAAAAIVRTVLALGESLGTRCWPRASRPSRSGNCWPPAKAAPRARAICSPDRWRSRNCPRRSRPRRDLCARMNQSVSTRRLRWPLRANRLSKHCHCNDVVSSIRRETIHQAVAAGALEIGLRAAAIRSARGMRAVPGFRRVIVAQSDAVGMTDECRALRAARPVLAGAIVARRKGRTVGLRSRQHVVPVRRIATAVDDIAFLGKRGLFGQIVGAVQLGDILGDHDALRILPRSLADAVARIHGGCSIGGLGRKISAPGFGARAGRLRQGLAVIVGAGEAAEIAAIADAGRCEEERGVGSLRPRGPVCNNGKRDRREKAKARAREDVGESGHRFLRFSCFNRRLDRRRHPDFNTLSQTLFRFQDNPANTATGDRK